MKRHVFREFNDEKWEQVRTHPHFARLRENTVKKADEKINAPLPVLKYSDIHLFAETGNRYIFENLYHEYTNRLPLFFSAYLITLDEKYIAPLADVIWCICDMESWSIPAHVSETLSVERRRRNLDLTSTILGFHISEILYYIGDKLPDLVRRRAEHDVRERVIDSYAMYRDNEFWWYKSTNNWSAVCIGAILSAYLYLAEDEEIERELPRMLDTVECYLNGFEDDGCCLEGGGYWHYGFSYFCIFASMLRDYTDGRIDLFKNEKVHKIATFPLNIRLNDHQCVNFSDSSLNYKPCAWMMPFLKSVYPDIKLPPIEPTEFVGPPLRYILWQDHEVETANLEAESHIFENAQWFIHVGENYSVGAKAGYNAEPHNHNDIGSFVISKGGSVTFSDAGTGEYTRQYFSAERYKYFVTSSRGHSVPIINGEYQVTGKVKSKVYRSEADNFSFSMENGYSIPSLESLTRELLCESDVLIITDTYSFSETPDSVVERFISLEPISEKDGKIICGASTMSFDREAFDVEISSEQVSRSQGRLEPVYYADLKVKNPAKNMKLEFKFN